MERLWRQWQDRSASTFFQTFEWASLLSRHFKFLEPSPLTGEGWFIPLMRRRRWGGFSDSLYGMPFMTPGGILRDHELGALEWGQVFAAVCQRHAGTVAIVLTPGDTVPPQEGFTQEVHTTHVVDLEGGWEAVWARYRQKARTAARKAGLLGITIRSGTGDQDIRSHWEIVRSHFPDWKPDPEPTSEFVRDAASLPMSRLYLAEHQRVAVGSVLVFVFGKEVFFLQGARLPQSSLPGVSNLLYSKVLEDACAQGFERANLGASLGNRRIEAFKESLGGRKVPYMVLKRVHPWLRLLRRG
jgi:hypothetical protein